MEKEQDKMNHEQAIALMGQDIAYIKKDLTKMSDKLDSTDVKLDAVLNHYIHRAEFETKIKEVNIQIDSRYKELDEKKLNREDFRPYKRGLNRITWTILSVVTVAMLALIIK